MTRPIVADAKTRFSVRVGDYVRYRPGYPGEIVGWLRGEIGFNEGWVVADVGAGTGISAKVFLEAGCEVVAVEPNREMREAAVGWLGGSARFRAVDGAAEATGLGDASVDMVVCAQAFHWFDLAGAKREFRRILRGGRALGVGGGVARNPHPSPLPEYQERGQEGGGHAGVGSEGDGGWVVLMWNDRNRVGSGFAEGYDALLRRWCVDYERVRHDQVPEGAVREFLGAGVREGEFPNRQEFDFEGLKGRLMSSSYAPREGHPNHAPMVAALWDLFERNKVGGRVTFEYRTRLFCGRLC